MLPLSRSFPALAFIIVACVCCAFTSSFPLPERSLPQPAKSPKWPGALQCSCFAGDGRVCGLRQMKAFLYPGATTTSANETRQRVFHCTLTSTLGLNTLKLEGCSMAQQVMDVLVRGPPYTQLCVCVSPCAMLLQLWEIFRQDIAGNSAFQKDSFCYFGLLQCILLSDNELCILLFTVGRRLLAQRCIYMTFLSGQEEEERVALCIKP